MNSHTDPSTVTPAQEAITISMLAALLACGVTSYILVEFLQLNTILGYAALALTSFVVAGYLVPNLTACWLGRTLDDIMDPQTTTKPYDPDEITH